MKLEKNEIIKDIDGWEKIYAITNLGRVWAYERVFDDCLCRTYIRRGRWLTPSLNNRGYTSVALCTKNTKATVSVHRLVAKAFVANPRNLNEVNHINGVKNDNRACNLEWVTHSENINHAVKTGLQHSLTSEKHWNVKLKKEQVEKIRKDYATNKYKQTELGRKYGVHKTTIGYIVNRKTWREVL